MAHVPALYVVATPIGNLGDMVPRAVEILQSVDLVAAEDTRHSGRLLRHFHIDVPMVACHDHNETGAVAQLLRRLSDGASVALICDAGTPLISDPGYRLVDAALTAGVKVVPIPGASAAIAALSVAGLPSDRFVFEGFLPPKAGARTNRLGELAGERRTLIFYEAPHRLLETLRDMAAAFGGERIAVLARELTKLHETVLRLPLVELLARVEEDADQRRGEIVLLVRGAEAEGAVLAPEAESTLRILLEELPLKQAAALAAKLTGASKNQLYQRALEWKGG